jgi:hypothetical protein
MQKIVFHAIGTVRSSTWGRLQPYLQLLDKAKKNTKTISLLLTSVKSILRSVKAF